MKCPKCGGEIHLFDLRPNCKHCGVNIMYFTQHEGLIRDAKRTELESAVARMVVARIKAAFIGGKLQIMRMIAVIGAVCVLMIPFIGVHYTLPFFDKKLSIGLIGLIQSFGDGLLLKQFDFVKSTMFSKFAVSEAIILLLFVVILLIDLLIFGAFCIGFLNLTKTTKFMKNTSLIGAIIALITQIAVFVLKGTVQGNKYVSINLGFGALAAFAVFVIMYFINAALLKKGIEPTYREFDPKRKELLKKVRAGEVDLDSLTLPVFESEEEREERIKALEEALKIEEEGKEL
ncbi:MAG: hypothetical protein IK097_03145 [Clostridia bacterium]|nr:hypothetical protein [Clostridia bacterium]